MKITSHCYPCLAQLVHQAAEFATEDAVLRAQAVDEGLKLLEQLFSMDKVSIQVATPLHHIVREITGNADPYLPMKESEMVMARELRRNWELNPPQSLSDAIILAVRGNNIDFFKDMASIKKDLQMPVAFAIDHTGELEPRLKQAKSILYLADNTGEVLFDLPLLTLMREFGAVTYVVKESPVQNDITFADLERFDLMRETGTVITTGTNTPGVDMDKASAEFKAAFYSAELVLAKGMGFWETLSELPAEGRVFHLLKAKCQPVADSVGVGLDDYVALLR